MKARRPTTESPRQSPTFRVPIQRWRGGRPAATQDVVAREEPLELHLKVGSRPARRLAVTMRTPGADRELAAGFLVAEGLVSRTDDIVDVNHDPIPGEAQEFNAVTVTLRPNARIDWSRLERPFLTTSACGVCGRSTLDALEGNGTQPIVADSVLVRPTTLSSLPVKLRKVQDVFQATGGLHAAGLFDARGRLIELREDVGRHNAVDKVVGARFLAGGLPLSNNLLLVSGRASFEILQKAARAGIPMVAAVGAPSSLAVDTALRFGQTLVGFLRDDRFNVYANPQRVRP